MVSRLRLCSEIQSARASASATVVIASTSTASYSPKIKVDVIGSKPSGSPKGFGRSPTIGFPGAVKTFTLSAFDVAGAVTRVLSFGPFVPPIWRSFRWQSVSSARYPTTAASSAAIPSWLAPFRRAQVQADLLDANAAEATPHL